MKLDQRFCGGCRSINEVDKGNKERVHLGKRTEVSNGGDEEEGVYL